GFHGAGRMLLRGGKGESGGGEDCSGCCRDKKLAHGRLSWNWRGLRSRIGLSEPFCAGPMPKSRINLDRLDTSCRGCRGSKPPACSGPAIEIAILERQFIRRKRKIAAAALTQS